MQLVHRRWCQHSSDPRASIRSKGLTSDFDILLVDARKVGLHLKRIVLLHLYTGEDEGGDTVRRASEGTGKHRRRRQHRRRFWLQHGRQSRRSHLSHG